MIREDTWCPPVASVHSNAHTCAYTTSTQVSLWRWEGNGVWWCTSIIPVLGRWGRRTATNMRPVWPRARPYQVKQGVTGKTWLRALVSVGRNDGGKGSKLDQIKDWVVWIISVSSELWCCSLVDFCFRSGAIQSLCEICLRKWLLYGF